MSGEVFVGRRGELLRLEQLLGQALLRAGNVVFITGDAGMGKTALLREFFARAKQKNPALTLFRAHCEEQYGSGEAYLPFLNGLSRLLTGHAREPTLSMLKALAPTWHLQLPGMVGAEGARESLERQTIGATKERMLREMGDMLAVMAQQTAVAGLVEDIQWADRSTIDLLRHIGDRLPRLPFLMLLTFRPGALEAAEHPLRSFVLQMRAHGYCREIELGALSLEDVQAYLDARFVPNRFPEGLAALVHGKTEGNPLFVSNIAQFLVERGDIASADGEWRLTREIGGEIDVPVSVRAAVKRKLEALGDEDRTALQYASVLGREFLSTLLAALTNADELALEERLRRLDRAHRVVDTIGEEELPDGSLATRYRFTNALYQEILYEELVAKRRILLHRQVAEQLIARYQSQVPRIASQLALHFERGRDFSSAVAHLAQAGDNAARVYAYGEAFEHLSHALELLAKLTPEEQARLAPMLHEKRGAVNHARGRFDLATDDYGRMLECARAARSPALEYAALAGSCKALFFSYRLAEAAVRADEALAAAARAGSETLRVEALTLVALVLQDGGELAESKPLLEDVVAVSRRLRHLPSLLAGLVYRGTTHYWQSEFAAAETLMTEAQTLARDTHDGFMLLICHMFLGLARGNLGRMGDAFRTLEKGIELARKNGDRFWLPRLLSQVGWAHRELQDFAGAIEYDREGLRVAREGGSPWAEASALLNLAVDHTQAGQLESAAALFQELDGVMKGEGWLGWHHDLRLQAALSEHWRLRGDFARSEEHARRLLEAAARHQARTYLLSAQMLLAEAALAKGDPEAAIVHLAEGLDPERCQSAPLAAWKTYATLGRVLSRLDDEAAAREAYGQAASIVRSMAASFDDWALQDRFLGSPAVLDVLSRVPA